MTFDDDVAGVIAAMNFGRPAAKKVGSGVRPYAAMTHYDVAGRVKTKRMVGMTFATAEEASAYAAQIIEARRAAGRRHGRYRAEPFDVDGAQRQALTRCVRHAMASSARRRARGFVQDRMVLSSDCSAAIWASIWAARCSSRARSSHAGALSPMIAASMSGP